MDIGGIGRLRNIFPFLKKEGIKRNEEADRDRDAMGSGGYQKNQEKPQFLTPEQEEIAVTKLNELPAFSKAGLKAILVREEGKHPIVVVKDKEGQIVRHVPYAQLVQMFLDRNLTGKETGRLLNRAA